MQVSPLEKPRPIAPYITQDYWDGAAIGKGPTNAVYPSKPSSALADFALDCLQTALASGSRGQPVATYQNGSTFEFEDHLPGTVIVFERETLIRGEKHKKLIDIDQTSQVQLPRRQTRLTRELKASKHRSNLVFKPDILTGYGRVYEDAILYGVVALNRRNQVRLVTLPSTQLFQAPRTVQWERGLGKKAATVGPVRFKPYKRATPRVETTPITVGEVRMPNNSHRGKQKLVRVNALQVIMAGERVAEAQTQGLVKLIHNLHTTYPRLWVNTVDTSLA